MVFVAAQMGLEAADFTDDDDPWATILALGVPLLVGLVVARWWAVALSLTPLLLYAIDPTITGELAPWFWLAVSIAVNAACLALGITVGRLARRLRWRST
jgi:hypothetical protein